MTGKIYYRNIFYCEEYGVVEINEVDDKVELGKGDYIILFVEQEGRTACVEITDVKKIFDVNGGLYTLNHIYEFKFKKKHDDAIENTLTYINE